MTEEQKIEELEEQKRKLEARLSKVNAKLLQAEKVKSDFLSNIKNEINNPLTSILGLMSQVLNDPENIQQTKVNSSLVYNEVYQLNFQMRNIFHAAEIEAGQSAPQLARLNLRHLIEDTMASFSPMSSKRDITLDLTYESDDSFITDREKLEVIIANLLANAIKFSPSSSEVTIRVTDSGKGGVSILVRDYGVGIKDQDLELIYDRFKQLDSGTRKEFGGHGLGLSIVHSLIDILDGSLQMKSEYGKGAEFVIELPMGNDGTGDEVIDDEILFTATDEEGEVF